MNFKINLLYLCVLDMEQAISFYEEFFEKKFMRKTIYSVFNIDGFRLGLFAFEKVEEIHTFGSNCLPSISVENIDIFNRKLEGLKIVFPITKIGKNWVAEFEDSEGNHIELTTQVE